MFPGSEGLESLDKQRPATACLSAGECQNSRAFIKQRSRERSGRREQRWGIESSLSPCPIAEGHGAGWQREEAAAAAVLPAAIFRQLWSGLRSPAANPRGSVTDRSGGCANEPTVAVPGGRSSLPPQSWLVLPKASKLLPQGCGGTLSLLRKVSRKAAKSQQLGEERDLVLQCWSTCTFTVWRLCLDAQRPEIGCAGAALSETCGGQSGLWVPGTEA